MKQYVIDYAADRIMQCYNSYIAFENPDFLGYARTISNAVVECEQGKITTDEAMRVITSPAQYIKIEVKK